MSCSTALCAVVCPGSVGYKDPKTGHTPVATELTVWALWSALLSCSQSVQWGAGDAFPATVFKSLMLPSVKIMRFPLP